VFGEKGEGWSFMYAERDMPRELAIASAALKADSPRRRRWLRYGEGMPVGGLWEEEEEVRVKGESASEGMVEVDVKAVLRGIRRCFAVGGV
jgi:hypothetical protein